MNWSIKRRYGTMFGGAGDSETVTLEIIWRAYCPRNSTSRAKSSFPCLRQEIGRALAEFRIERIPPQKSARIGLSRNRLTREWMPRVEIIGVLGFVLVHVGSNDQVSRLLQRGCAVRITGPLLRRQEPPAQQAGVIGILVDVRTKPDFEFE